MKLRNNNTLGMSAKTIALFLGASALSLTSCRDNDFDWNEHYNQDVEHAYAEFIESVFGEVAPDKSWDLSGALNGFVDFGAASQTRAEQNWVTPVKETNTTNFVKLDGESLSWIKDNLTERQSNASKGNPFELVIPENLDDRTFTLTPIYQGESLCWDFHMVIENGNDRQDITLFKKDGLNNTIGVNGATHNSMGIQIKCLKCGGTTTHSLGNFFQIYNYWPTNDGKTIYLKKGNIEAENADYNSCFAILRHRTYTGADEYVMYHPWTEGFVRVTSSGMTFTDKLDQASTLDVEDMKNNHHLKFRTAEGWNRNTYYLYKANNEVNLAISTTVGRESYNWYFESAWVANGTDSKAAALNTFLNQNQHYTLFPNTLGNDYFKQKNNSNAIINNNNYTIKCTHCDSNGWVNIGKYENAEYTTGLRAPKYTFTLPAELGAGTRIYFYAVNTCGEDDITANPGHFGCSLEPGGDKHFETLLEFSDLESSIKSGLGITSDKIVKVFGLEDNDVPNDKNGLPGTKPTGGAPIPGTDNTTGWTASDIDYNDLLILYEGKLQSRKTTTEYKDEDVQKRYMVEDLGYGGNAQTFNASDMDFNDIVVDFISNCRIRETTRYKWESNNWVQDGQATKEVVGVNSTTVKVWALGGTLDFELWAGDTKLFTKGGTTASNQTFGTLDAHTMYNTKDPALFPNLGDEYSDKYDEQNPIHVFTDTNKAWDPKTDNVIFKITEQDSDKDFGDDAMEDGGLNSSFLRKTITFPQAGEKNPRIIAVPITTVWKEERETVTTDWLNSTVQNL